MLFCCGKYLRHRLQRKLIGSLMLMLFSAGGYAQNVPMVRDSLFARPASPVVVSISKKPVQLMRLRFNPPYKPYFARKGGELMHWPNYPLTAAQIIARQADWQRRNNQRVGERVAGDIIKNSVNALIYGRKSAPATIPKF